MVGGKIIDCQLHIAIFFEAADSLVVFGFVKFDEMIKGRQGILACLGHLDVLQGGLGLLFGSGFVLVFGVTLAPAIGAERDFS